MILDCRAYVRRRFLSDGAALLLRLVIRKYLYIEPEVPFYLWNGTVFFCQK